MAVKTLAQLKELHESGEKLTNNQRKKIRAQLSRECGYRDCNESLAFSRKGKGYCSTKCLKREKSRIRRANRLKKARYYAKHGIKFNKNIKKAKVTAYAKSKEDFELIYDNYKEPLKEIPKTKGYGYYGTIATTADKELIQCHICGNLYKGLSGHIVAHRITVPDYKERFQLAATTALVADSVREAMQKRAITTLGGKLPEHLVKYNAAGQPKAKGGAKWSLEQRNKMGLCPDQVLEKISDLATKLGHTPSMDEFNAEYKGRYVGSIKYQHGSYLEAVKKLGLTSAKELKEPSNEKLLQDLIDFKEKHGRIPMTSDFARGLLRPRAMYFRRFGTLNNARIEAGLNAVIPMGFGQLKEMTPDEYLAYKASH